MAIIQTQRPQLSTNRTLPASGGNSRQGLHRQRRPASSTKRSAGRKVVGVRHIRNKELIPFTRQSAGMLNAGMSIIATISTLQEQASHSGFRALLTDLRNAIESGSPFSEGLALHEEIFGEMYINMVRAGEKSGQFAEIMKRLAALLDSSARLVRKVKSALTYPIVIMLVAVLIAFLLVTFVVPVFGEMFEGFGAKLPLPTQILMNTSAFIENNWYLLLGGFFGAGWLFRRWAKTAGGQRTIHRSVLKLPVFGALILKVVIARFSRLLGQMLTSGVSILDAMEITARSCGNKVIEDSLMAARTAVEEGQTLSAAMDKRPYLPTLLVRMSAAGEKSGRLDEMLVNVADAYDDEVETMLGTLTSLMEPFLMVFLGVFIGGIIVALFLPIFQIGNIVAG